MREEIYKKIMRNKKIMDFATSENEEAEFLSTGVIVLNLLFSGRVDGGIPVGKVSQIAAPSGLGKSFVGLTALANAQRKGFFGIVFDTENAFDFKWAQRIGVDTSPESLFVYQENMIEDVRQKFLEMMKDLSIEERMHTFVLLDSYGGLLTSKTIEDAEIGKDVADMTESKKKNRLAKMLMGKKITGFVVNHVYDNISGYGDAFKIPGGRGLEFSTSCIVQGNSMAKEKNSQKEISGAIVTAITNKSRFGKRWSKLQYRLKNNGGLDVFYGLLPDAMEHGCVTSPNQGWYVRAGDDHKYREKDIYNIEFWLPIFKDTDFKKHLEDKYSFKSTEIDVASVDINEMVSEE